MQLFSFTGKSCASPSTAWMRCVPGDLRTCATQPTPDQVQALLRTVADEGGYSTNLIVRLLYGCGLRVVEPLNLRVKDVNLQQSRLCIRGAKGGKDRVVLLPSSLLPELVQQMDLARAMWRRN